jgi:hypothetical protein
MFATRVKSAEPEGRQTMVKAQLCEKFGLPLLRISMLHLNEKNFNQPAAAFFVHQYFAVQNFLQNRGRDPREIFEPAFYATAPGLEAQWPFAYAARWRQRLKKRLASEVDRFKPELADRYRHGLVQLAAYESTWIKGNEIKSISGMKVGDTDYVYGQAWLNCKVFGFEERTRECFLRNYPVFPIWIRPTRPKAAGTLARPWIPSFTRRVR